MNPVQLPSNIAYTLKRGGVFVPSPLALDAKKHLDESYQRLLTLYYIKSGAAAVIPGAHTGEFAGDDEKLLERWLVLVKEMVGRYGGGNILLMAAIGGVDVLHKAETAAKHGYDIAMVAPTAFSGKPPAEVIMLLRDIASVIPVFGFELQRAIQGSYSFTSVLWQEIFQFACGAKGASFDTYRSLVMLEAAAKSDRKASLTLLTGNDDRIVADLAGSYAYPVAKGGISTVQYAGGLLGHFATDTHAARNWVDCVLKKRAGGEWTLRLSEAELAHAVNRCNMALFDALNNFENSVWGVKYRLTKLGLLPAPICFRETGSADQAESIDGVYSDYDELNDRQFLREQLDDMKKEVGIRNRY
jgi:dihydrodipicolinate synthase/N-acetylneuraminate lyase